MRHLAHSTHVDAYVHTTYMKHTTIYVHIHAYAPKIDEHVHLTGVIIMYHASPFDGYVPHTTIDVIFLIDSGARKKKRNTPTAIPVACATSARRVSRQSGGQVDSS